MQPVKLELLAPAKNKDIGIAAIDCGADAVYIAGPSFGARAAAGNPVGDIASLTAYAHKFSAKIYATVNTIIFEDELRQAQRMIWELYDAGVDALIVQDLGITRMELPPIELHASTQCAIRTPEKARVLEDMGFRRLILERQLSLDEIGKIRNSVNCELEFFVHGAICVCYSGNCYLSQCLAGRSANRGACIQACRSLYDVVDGDGRVLAHDSGILSPKDYRLDGRLEDLADAGVCSFKIEGRLKNDSYVKNLCRHYRNLLDGLCERRPGDYEPASSGTLAGGFSPNPAATFNRGYTEFFIDGKRSRWNSIESTKSIGEYVGDVESVTSRTVIIKPSGQLPGQNSKMPGKNTLSNGDGLVFVGKGGLIGMRADVVNGNEFSVKDVAGIAPGDNVYRNYNIKFEHELQANMPRRKIDVTVVFDIDSVTATDADGYCATLPLPFDAPVADKQEAASENIRRNMGKSTGHFDFECIAVEQSPVRFYPAAVLNALRRDLASELEKLRVEKVLERRGTSGQALSSTRAATVSLRQVPASGIAPDSDFARASYLDYTANCANHLAKEVLESCGFERVEPAYELEPKPGAELVRSRYCVKYELGLCPKLHPATRAVEPLYLVNAGKRLRLQFDCKNCEMIVTLP
ncbi:MAG: U32 family peptidase [Bacteroidales bacterium]|nr:U32 family peptidase [Bacteroidales bacterium]